MNILCCKIPFYRLPPNIFFHCFLWFMTLFFHDPFHPIFAPTISSLPLFYPLAFDFLPSNPSPLSQPSIFFLFYHYYFSTLSLLLFSILVLFHSSSYYIPYSTPSSSTPCVSFSPLLYPSFYS